MWASLARLVGVGSIARREDVTERAALLALVGLALLERWLRRHDAAWILTAACLAGLLAYPLWLLAPSVAAKVALVVPLTLAVTPVWPLVRARAWAAMPDRAAGMVLAIASLGRRAAPGRRLRMGRRPRRPCPHHVPVHTGATPGHPRRAPSTRSAAMTLSPVTHESMPSPTTTRHQCRCGPWHATSSARRVRGWCCG